MHFSRKTQGLLYTVHCTLKAVAGALVLLLQTLTSRDSRTAAYFFISIYLLGFLFTQPINFLGTRGPGSPSPGGEFLSPHVASPITAILYHISVASRLIIPSVGNLWLIGKSKLLHRKSGTVLLPGRTSLC